MLKVRVAILGCGGYAGAHAQRLAANSDADIVALCDVNEKIVDKFCTQHMAECSLRPEYFTNSADMYAQVKPDAVVVSTPHTLHFEHCMDALEHGCHVLVEKPMVTEAIHAYKLKRKVDQTGKILVIGYNTPCTPEFHYLRQHIRDGTFGKLELVSGHLVQSWLHPTKGSWRQNAKLSGGGQAYDSGAHLLNSLCWSVESNVSEVFAFVDNMGAPVDINSAINIRFESGVFAAIVIGGNCPINDSYLMYVFAQGRIAIDGWSGSWIDVHDRHGHVKYPHITGCSQWPDDNFIDAILGRAKPHTSAVNGIVQSELMDAIYESAGTGRSARPKRP